ncbi:MAG: folylpolyglutamate synthase/dihydrofolate synthase family protein [Acidimicrobiia bacterium]
MEPDPWAWLEAHVNLESMGVPAGESRRASHPTLDRMEALAALLGSPQLDVPAIHVTGTNGKTSVTRLTTALLVGNGIAVGSYTSPHLERVNERIVRDATPITDADLAALLMVVADVEPHLPAPPSYFEILTGAAFRHFADTAAEAAVLEVGLGGRWDATNVVDAVVAVITNISVDHVEYLGPTRDDIASEKAGIVKKGATLVLGETDPALRSHFDARDPATAWQRDRDFGLRANALAHGGRVVSIFTPEGEYPDVFLSLHGAHQADNAAISVAAAEAFLGRALGHDVVAEVLAQATSPGRLEVMGHQPLVLLDGAHNVAGAEALTAAIAEGFPSGPRTLVVGLLREKDPAEMLAALGVPDVARLVCCRPPSARALAPEEVATAAAAAGMDPDRVEVVEEVPAAVARALLVTGPDAQVVVTGSLYTVGAARGALTGSTDTLWPS